MRLVRKPNPYLSHHWPQPFGLVDVVICFAAVLVLPGIVAALLMTYWGASSESELSNFQRDLVGLTLALTQICFVAITLGYVVKRYGALSKVLGIAPANFGQHLKLAFKSFAMVVPGLLVLQLLLSLLAPYEHGTLSGLQERFSLLTTVVSWLGAVIAAPICEEILFRGFLQGWLQRLNFDARENPMVELAGGWPESQADESAIELSRFRWWFPIVVSSVFFAAVHIGQGLAPVPLFFFGGALGVLYRYSGSIVPCIVLHFLLNAMSMFKATLEVYLQAS